MKDSRMNVNLLLSVSYISTYINFNYIDLKVVTLII
jgi:hypothetical protein